MVMDSIEGHGTVDVIKAYMKTLREKIQQCDY